MPVSSDTRVELPVLFIGQTGALGGAELSLLDTLKARSRTSRMILLADGPFRQLLEAAHVDVRVIEVGIDVRRNSGLWTALSSGIAVLRAAIAIARQAAPYSVIYANTQKALVVGALASLLARKPLVWHLHDILSADHFSAILRRVAVTVANLRASVVIANSRATAESFRLAGGKLPAIVIHQGISPLPFDKQDGATAAKSLRQEIGATKATLVGVFGRLARWKGQHIAIEALRQLPDVELVLVGAPLFGEESYEHALRQQAAAAGVADRVHFLGFRSDVAAVMKGVDIIVHCSVAPEPFGRVVVEGMLANRPVVAADAGGVSEIIDNGVQGILVPPGNAEALADALAKLIADPAMRERLAAAGRARALADFSLEACLAAVNRAITQAADGTNQPGRARR
jgi:glycosyltransferase involved in cell wall biosynthesis